MSCPTSSKWHRRTCRPAAAAHLDPGLREQSERGQALTQVDVGVHGPAEDELQQLQLLGSERRALSALRRRRDGRAFRGRRRAQGGGGRRRGPGTPTEKAGEGHLGAALRIGARGTRGEQSSRGVRGRQECPAGVGGPVGGGRGDLPELELAGLSCGHRCRTPVRRREGHGL